MANFDEQMRLFEAEVGQGPPRPRPPIMPQSLRPRGGRGGHLPRGHVPPPPSFPPRAKNYGGGQKQYSSPAVISKPAENNDDDVFSTLLKYEKEVRQEKREKKKEAKTQNQAPAKPPKEQKTQESIYKTATIAAPPVKPPSSSSNNPMVPAALMKPSHISAQPTVTPVVKPGTQVTPDEIKLKAKQMVELVKASQVIQTKKLPQAQGTSKPPSEGSGKMKKPKKMIRVAGGQVWEDTSLLNWDHNDFRLFCGDLGNDVTDEVLTRTFSRYPSFQKARVIRDKRSNKSKGYGFVSFKDPADFTRAIKELNGKYVGSRPIKLSKSNWKDRNIDIVKTKQTVKKQMGYKY